MIPAQMESSGILALAVKCLELLRSGECVRAVSDLACGQTPDHAATKQDVLSIGSRTQYKAESCGNKDVC